MTAKEADTIRGVVIVKTNRFSDSAVTLLNVSTVYSLFWK